MAGRECWRLALAAVLAAGCAVLLPLGPAVRAADEAAASRSENAGRAADPAAEAQLLESLLANGWDRAAAVDEPELGPSAEATATASPAAGGPLDPAESPAPEATSALPEGAILVQPLPALPEWIRPAPVIRAAPLAIDEFVLQDAVDVVVIDRRVVAFDARGSGQIGVPLELGEEVISSASKGRVGVAITNRRMLGITLDAFSWRDLRFRVDEAPVYDAALGQRAALVVTDRRVLGFDGGSGAWLEADLGPRERIEGVRVGPSTAIVVTDRRALGLSPESGGFFEQDLELRERLERVTAGVGVATITTSRRVLVFRGLSGVWTTQRRALN